MRRIRMISLVIVIAGVSLAHYLTPSVGHGGVEYQAHHALYQWFYYLPIILAGFWFGLRGGIATAILVTLLYVPHVIIQWHGGTAEQWLEIALYSIVGFTVGWLSQRQKRDRDRYFDAARNLDHAYRELKEQTEVLLDTEGQLRRADRLGALGRLSAGLAHEIKTPLSSIRGAAEILERQLLLEGESAEFLDILISETDRLNHVVKRFLDFAKEEPEEPGATPVAGSVHQVCALVEAAARRRKVEIAEDVARGLPPVCMPGGPLRQILVNLAVNAIEAMEAGGRLTISARGPEPGSVAIVVEDTGPGIPGELLPRIFDPFVTGKDCGTGLGLSIVDRLVRSQGGTIRVDSTTGQGTRFEITLPVGEPSRVP